MTEKDQSPDEDSDSSSEVGGFQFGVTDGAGGSDPSTPDDDTDDSGGPFDFRSWLGDRFPDRTRERSVSDPSDSADEATSVSTSRFGGFSFTRWLEETDVRTTSESEPEDEELETVLAEESPSETTPTSAASEATAETDASAAATATAAAFQGFDFNTWITDRDSIGPQKPPDSPRVVGRAPPASESSSSGALALLPFVGGAEDPTVEDRRFDFAGWLAEGDSELLEPVAVDDEPLPEPTEEPATEPVATGAVVEDDTAGGEPAPAVASPDEPSSGLPSPSGGGISKTPPIKFAVVAVFAATLVAVGLTMGGALAPLGPSSGFGSPSAGDSVDQEPAATETPTPEPEPETDGEEGDAGTDDDAGDGDAGDAGGEDDAGDADEEDAGDAGGGTGDAGGEEDAGDAGDGGGAGDAGGADEDDGADDDAGGADEDDGPDEDGADEEEEDDDDFLGGLLGDDDEAEEEETDSDGIALDGELLGL